MKMLKDNFQHAPAERPPLLTQPASKPAFETPVMNTTLDLLDRAAEIELMRLTAKGKAVPVAYNEVRGMSIALAHWSASFGRFACLHILWVALRAMFIPVWRRELRRFRDHRAKRNPNAPPRRSWEYF